MSYRQTHPEGEGGELIKRLRSGEWTRSLFRSLGRFGVSVYEDHFLALERAGDLELLEDGSAILINPRLYGAFTGLSLEAEAGKAYLL